MTEQPDYDDEWVAQAHEPDPTVRLRELVAELAQLLDLTVAGEPADAPRPPVTVKLACGRCNLFVMAVLSLEPGAANNFSDAHMCMVGADAATGQPPSIFPFTITVGSGS